MNLTKKNQLMAFLFGIVVGILGIGTVALNIDSQFILSHVFLASGLATLITAVAVKNFYNPKEEKERTE